jgi:divalent metal cation (Fe/Co/Zn/Cd) transporter
MDKSPKEFFKLTSIIHIVIAIPMVLMAIGVYYYNTSNQLLIDDNPMLLYIPLGIMMVAIIAGRPLYNKILQQNKTSTFERKMQAFMKATIARDAIFEAAGLVACVFAYLTGNNTLLLLIAIIILQFYINRPSIEKIENDLRASKEELKALD